MRSLLVERADRRRCMVPVDGIPADVELQVETRSDARPGTRRDQITRDGRPTESSRSGTSVIGRRFIVDGSTRNTASCWMCTELRMWKLTVLAPLRSPRPGFLKRRNLKRCFAACNSPTCNACVRNEKKGGAGQGAPAPPQGFEHIRRVSLDTLELQRNAQACADYS